MHPGIEVIEAAPEADRRLLESLADWCDRYTPLVALDGKDGLFLDITGCAHLFGGDKAMLSDMVSRFFHHGFDVRAGLASTTGAAWAASRYLSFSIIPCGEEAKTLAPLPLAALRLEERACAGLESVGLKTAASVMTAPRAPLARRFGRNLLLRLDQATGAVEEPISPRLAVAPLSVERQLAEPVSLTEDIERLVGILAGSLKSHLERRGEGARRLELALFRVDDVVTRIGLGASRPLREPASIQRLFHERLIALEAGIDAGYGFDLVRLSVLSAAPFQARQTDLSGEDEGEGEELALFADRIEARLGRGAILRPIAVESHVPERAIAHITFAETLAPSLKRRSAKLFPDEGSAGGVRRLERPIRLFRSPEPVEVSPVELPEGPPRHFRWRRVLHNVARAEGPERIAPEWWHDRQDAPTRDYFRVEDADGRRYWLYRQGLYDGSQEAPRWFMHGVFP